MEPLKIILVVFSCVQLTLASEFVKMKMLFNGSMNDAARENTYRTTLNINENCDLVEGKCETNCCNDPDCSDFQKKSFNCLDVVPLDKWSIFSCQTNLERPPWMSALCFYFNNSPYLGDFYQVLGSKEENRIIKRKLPNRGFVEKKESYSYVVGNDVRLAFIHEKEKSFKFLVQKSISSLSKACIKAPLKMFVNVTSVCRVMVSSESCKNRESLSFLPFGLASNPSTALLLPVVISDPLAMNPVFADIRVYNVSSGQNLTVGKNLEQFWTAINLKDQVCSNVLQSLRLQFYTYGSKILNISAMFNLSTVRLLPNGKAHYIDRKIEISFADTTPGCAECDSSRGRRGYFIGEPLSGGFLRNNGSEIIWINGKLELFQNGGYCNATTPITFGLDSQSSCHYFPPRADWSNCTTLSDEYFTELINGCTKFYEILEKIKEKLKNLTVSDFVAPYMNFVSPWPSPVHLLWKSPPQFVASNGKCEIPIMVTTMIQYTTNYVQQHEGHPFRQIIGAKVDVEYQNISVADFVTLGSQAFFVELPHQKPSAMSRFWNYVYSREGAAFAWLNLFHAFDGHLTAEKIDENFFWTIFISSISLLMVLFGHKCLF